MALIENPSPAKYTIYLITNLVNGKYYVGQTKRSLARRWSGHLASSRKRPIKSYVHSAIVHYGDKSFAMETLAEVETREEANNLERVWILLLNSTDRALGYNIALGGSACPRTEEYTRRISEGMGRGKDARNWIPIETEEMVRLYTEEQLSQRQIAKRLGCTRELVANRLKVAGVKGRTRSESLRLSPPGDYRHDIGNEDVRSRYDSGWTCREIARALGTNGATICYRLKVMGVTRRNPGTRSKRAHAAA